MQQFGHRAESSWELSVPRWRDNPDVVKVLAMAAGQHEDPARMAAQQAERVKARANLTGWLGRWWGSHEVPLLRESWFHFDRLLDVWAGQPGLRPSRNRPGSMFATSRPPSWRLCSRENLKERLLQRVWPSGRKPGMWRRSVGHRVMSRRCFSVGSEVMAAEPGRGRLQGTGTSPGVVTGRVRILRSIMTVATSFPGEILVAVVSTDPGWTPLFQGGRCDHGAGRHAQSRSGCAREYGLPAVVNIGARPVDWRMAKW